MERGAILTRKGLNLITKVLAKECGLEITRCMVGEGVHDNLNTLIEGLLKPVAQATSSRPMVKDNRLDFFIEYRSDMNGGLDKPFYLSEFEIRALDPDEGEICLLLGSLGDKAESVEAANGGFYTVRRYPITIVVTGDMQVTISYAPLCFMTYEDVEEYFIDVALPVFLLEAGKLIAIHNISPEAHPDIRVKDSDQDARIKRLEDMLVNDISGNPYLITFENLDGVIVEGVWNRALARIEF